MALHAAVHMKSGGDSYMKNVKSLRDFCFGKSDAAPSIPVSERQWVKEWVDMGSSILVQEKVFH